MKKFLLLASILIFQTFGWCQNSSKITQFNGGIFNGDINLGRTPFSNMSFGYFPSTTHYRHWMNISINPAFVSMYRSASIFFQVAPQINIHPSQFIDIDSRIHSTFDQALADYKTKTTDVTYPKVESIFKSNKVWGEGLICFPVGKWYFALGYDEIFNLSARLELNGAGTGISTLVDMGGGTKSNVLFTAFLGSLVDLNFRINKTQLTLGRIFKGKNGVGLSIDRLAGSTQVYGRINMQGAMVFNGQEYIFDDPNDTWHNSLKQSIEGEYSGSGWRLTVGFWRPFYHNLVVDVTFRSKTRIDMMGNMNILQNKIPAFNLSALSSNNENAEIMDPVKLNLSQLTLTESVQNKTYSTMALYFPGRIAVGITWNKRRLYWYNNVAIQYGPSSLIYGPSEFQFIGLMDLTSSIGISDFYLCFGATKSRVRTTKINYLSVKEKNFWIPKLNFGYGKRIHQNYLFVAKVEILPNPLFYITTGFKFR